MASDAAKLLDELMGRERDLTANEKGVELDWSDEKVSSWIHRVASGLTKLIDM